MDAGEMAPLEHAAAAAGGSGGKDGVEAIDLLKTKVAVE